MHVDPAAARSQGGWLQWAFLGRPAAVPFEHASWFACILWMTWVASISVPFVINYGYIRSSAKRLVGTGLTVRVCAKS